MARRVLIVFVLSLFSFVARGDDEKRMCDIREMCARSLDCQHAQRYDEAYGEMLSAVEACVAFVDDVSTDESPETTAGQGMRLLVECYEQLATLYVDMDMPDDAEYSLALALTFVEKCEEGFSENERLDVLKKLVAVQRLPRIDNDELPSMSRVLPFPKLFSGEDVKKLNALNTLVELAHSYQKCEQWESSIIYFKKVLEQYWKSRVFYYDLGWINLAIADCYFELKNYAEAENYYAEATERFSAGHKYLGYTYLRRSQNSLMSEQYDDFFIFCSKAVDEFYPAYKAKRDYKKNLQNNRSNVITYNPTVAAMAEEYLCGLLHNMSVALGWYGETLLSKDVENLTQELAAELDIVDNLEVTDGTDDLLNKERRLTPNGAARETILEFYYGMFYKLNH